MENVIKRGKGGKSENEQIKQTLNTIEVFLRCFDSTGIRFPSNCFENDDETKNDVIEWLKTLAAYVFNNVIR